jgi:mono/diheme cytochrome c family protein
MKKLVSISILLLLLSLAACGRRLPETPLTTSNTTTTTTQTDVATADTPTEQATVEVEAEEDAQVEATEDEDEDEAVEVVDNDTDTANEDEAVTLAGDINNGAALFANVPGNAPCSSCHYVDSNQMLVGPGMLGLGDIAGERVAGEDAVEYLRNAILHPNDYIVDGYPAQVMPQNYADSLTEDDLNDLIAYMLSL